MEFPIDCPLCSERHKYRLRVDKTFIMHNMTLGMMGRETFSEKKFTRVFLCPSKNEQFQATISLEESVHEKITDVSIER